MVWDVDVSQILNSSTSMVWDIDVGHVCEIECALLLVNLRTSKYIAISVVWDIDMEYTLPIVIV